MHIHLLDPEHATILAALRYWQDRGTGDPNRRMAELREIATNDGQVIPLDAEGIDNLCERLNTPAGISTLEPGWLNRVSTAQVSILHLTVEDRRSLAEGRFTVCPSDPGSDHGYVVSTQAVGDCPADCFPGASPEFFAICKLAAEQGCALVSFSEGGYIYAGLHVYG